MPKLIITRGLPASGKTTRARAWVAEDPERRVRVNRDDIRAMIHDGVHIKQSDAAPGTENAVIHARDALISTALRAGRDVVCDDTNLPRRVACDLRRLADKHSAEFEVWDMTNVDLGTCIVRDAERKQRGGQSVGSVVIDDMHRRFIRGRAYPLPLPEPVITNTSSVTPYVPNPSGTPTYLVDLDGTTAIMCDRSPYDETRVGDDLPNTDVIRVIKMLADAGCLMIFMSGRTAGCADDTLAWIDKHIGVSGPLFTRAVGDTRKDSVIKAELFDRYVRGNLEVNVVGVFDDRKQVVEMWRRLGLTVFQVAEGDF